MDSYEVCDCYWLACLQLGRRTEYELSKLHLLQIDHFINTIPNYIVYWLYLWHCLVLFVGKVGDWKNYLSKEQDDKLNVKIALKLKHSGLFFHYTETDLS